MAGGHARPKSRVYAQRAGFRSITLRTSPAARSDWSLSADRRDESHHSTRGPSSPHAPSSPRPRKQAAVGGWRHGRSSAYRCGYTTKSDAAQPRGRARRGITICRRSAKASDTSGTDQGCTRVRDQHGSRRSIGGHARSSGLRRQYPGGVSGKVVVFMDPRVPQQHGPRCVWLGFLIPAIWVHAAGIKEARAREAVGPPSAQGWSSSAVGIGIQISV